MSKFNTEYLKKHPIGVAATIITLTASIVSGAWSFVVSDLRDKKAELITELQATKQRVSSLDSTLATYDGQCTSKMQAHGKELQDRCDKQISTVLESSKLLASSNERLFSELKSKDEALTTATTKNVRQQAALMQLRQLKADEKILSTRLNLLHGKHKALSREYGYNRIECEKKDFYGAGNICEHASMNKSELESVEREIESTKIQLAQVQQQIIQIQSAPK